MRRRRLVLVVLALASNGFAAEPERGEFAHRIPIEIKETGSVYRAPFTAQVYQGLTRADLRDLRVYNGDGQIVPHGIRRSSAEPEKRWMELPVFPIPVATGGASGDVSMFVATGPNGSVVALKTARAHPAERWTYIVDASRSQDPLAAVELGWEDAEPERHFVGVLTIEASDDLRTWRTIGQGTMASLQREGQVLTQRHIAVSPQRAKYLRLGWAEPQPAVTINRVKAEFRANPEPQRDWMALAGSGDAKNGEYDYVLTGKMPVDRARISLPTNSVARVTVWSRNRSGDPWVLHGQKTIFAILAGERELKDNEIPLRAISSDHYWRLRFDGQANGLGGTPSLELGWIPHELVFVARGSAPFTLAFGSQRVTPVGNYGIDELLHRSSAATERLEVRSAVLGTADTAPGDRIRAHGWPVEWRQWLLWGVLLAGVGGLAWLAVRIGRQLGPPAE